MAPLKLEEFDLRASPARVAIGGAATLSEDQQLDSFEQGYKDGWDDAIKAQVDDHNRISADLERNLQTLSFSFHEARAQVLKDLKPLFDEMLGKLLPEIAKLSLAPMINEHVSALAATDVTTQIELVTHPSNRPALETLVAGNTGLALQITEETSLGEGQVYLRFADTEQHIDLDSVLVQIKGSVDGFFELNQTEKAG